MMRQYLLLMTFFFVLPSNSSDPAPFGTILGVTDCEVLVFSSDYESIDKKIYPDDKSFVSFFNEEFTGYKYQCVELARRYWLVNFGVVFESIPMAYDIFGLMSARVVATNSSVPLSKFPNGCGSMPSKGSLLIWEAKGETFKDTGHVAVVVNAGPVFVDIVEQNVLDRVWTANYSRRLPAALDPESGKFTVTCTFEGSNILGWITIADESILNAGECLRPQPAEAPELQRRARQWLDRSDPAVQAWVEHHGERLAGGEGGGGACKDSGRDGPPPPPR